MILLNLLLRYVISHRNKFSFTTNLVKSSSDYWIMIFLLSGTDCESVQRLKKIKNKFCCYIAEKAHSCVSHILYYMHLRTHVNHVESN